MGTARTNERKVGFGKRNTRMTVAERKKMRRLMVRSIVKKLKAAGKTIDLQAINQEVVEKCGRKRQSQKPRHGTKVLAIKK